MSSNQDEENGRTGTGDLYGIGRAVESFDILYNLVGRAVPRALSSALLTVVGTPEYKAWAQLYGMGTPMRGVECDVIGHAVGAAASGRADL